MNTSDVCRECKELCSYYHDKFWNCQGRSKICPDFYSGCSTQCLYCMMNNGNKCHKIKDEEQE